MVGEISLRPIAKFAGAAMIASMAVGCRSEKVTQRSSIVSSGVPGTTAAAPMFKPDIARPTITSSLNNPYLSEVLIKWDNGNTITHYLYHEPGNMTELTDANLSYYDPLGNNAYYNNNSADTNYWGCGISAAQSVLSYFGIYLTREEINHQYIASHDISGSDCKIYVRPTDIYNGILQALYDYAGVGFLQEGGRGVKVNIETGRTPDDIAAHLADGYPVIALVEGGGSFCGPGSAFRPGKPFQGYKRLLRRKE